MIILGEVTLGELVRLCRTEDPKFAESLEYTFKSSLKGDLKITLGGEILTFLPLRPRSI